MTRGILCAWLFALGCGGVRAIATPPGPSPSPSPSPSTSPAPSTSPSTIATAVGTGDPEAGSVHAPPAAPRLEVVPPTDLAAAIASRLPAIELLPLACGRSEAEVVGSSERLCLQDTASGLSRATRRFVTSHDGVVRGARRGDDVVFAALDLGMTRTRYSGHLWRWTLADDRYVGLAELDDEAALFGAPRIVALDFGILVTTTTESGIRSLAWLFAEGELRRLRSVEDGLGPTWVVLDRTYTTTRQRLREVVSVVRLDGPRVVLDRIASYPRAWHLPLAVHFPGGRALVVSAVPRGARTELHVLEPPGADVRVLSVDVERPREARFEAEQLVLRTAAGWQSIDLATGVAVPATVPEPPSVPPQPISRSIHAIVPQSDGLVLTYADGAFRLGPEGVAPIEEVPAAPRARCHCEGESAVCGATRLAGGCTTTPELERIAGGDDDSAPTTSWAPDGRYRIDRLEADLTRITRTSDGARLWLRIVASGVLAQADDGAFQAPDTLPLDGYALRWGRSLLDAPVTALAPFRAALFRPTLVADFFSGRALPPADTTLPTSGS